MPHINGDAYVFNRDKIEADKKSKTIEEVFPTVDQSTHLYFVKECLRREYGFDYPKIA